MGDNIGVDVGGTFTDLVRISSDGQHVDIAKVPSTPTNQAEGVAAALECSGGIGPDIGLIVHGTTVTTNAVLERRMARTGLITTEGFRDILELGRRTRPHPYGMTGEFTPVIPRDLRIEVPERMDARGRVVTRLDQEAVRTAGEALLRAGCTSIVVHFLHAYANPSHELKAGEILASIWPNSYVTLAHKIVSECREFERGVTAAINASVQPIIGRYVTALDKRLRDSGYTREFLVMNGNGGMIPATDVAETAAKTVMSGPASGVMAAAFVGRLAGFPDLLTYDMGGTSTDVALIRGAEAAVSNEIELEHGLPIHVPMVDVRTVGAGGGSIASVNAAGLLEIGPESAGAQPGPICYGRGGKRPTISDANLLLGRLDPSTVVGDTGAAVIAQVEEAFDAMGDTLGLDRIAAAEAVVKVANLKMAGAIRMVSLSLGADPRDFALFAFGGAGPLHATALAQELGVPRVLIPALPGITNALGCVVADLRQDYVRTINLPLDQVDMNAVAEVFATQSREGRDRIAAAGIPVDDILVRHSADMQFVGQTHVLNVSLQNGNPSYEDLQSLFEKEYWARFQVDLPEIRPALVNLNTSVVGVRPPLDLSALAGNARASTLEAAQVGKRDVRISGEWHTTPIYSRHAIPSGVVVSGPAVLNQMDTTILLGSGDRATADAFGNLIVEVRK